MQKSLQNASQNNSMKKKKSFHLNDSMVFKNNETNRTKHENRIFCWFFGILKKLKICITKQLYENILGI